MTVDTTPLKKVIKAWRDLNAERAALMAEMGTDEEGNRKGTVEQWAKETQFNADELFRLRDIAGEAMQLVDEIEMFATATPLANTDGQPLVAVRVDGGDDGEVA